MKPAEYAMLHNVLASFLRFPLQSLVPSIGPQQVTLLAFTDGVDVSGQQNFDI